MFNKQHDLKAAAHEAEIVTPEAENFNGKVNVEFEFEDTVGAVILGVVALALTMALLLVIRQNRALVTQLRKGE